MMTADRSEFHWAVAGEDKGIEYADRLQPSPNFIFVSSVVLILTSIRKWEQSEMFREIAN